MAGGSCEATAFVAYGYVSTGLCLPLGNYHNMVDIDGVRDGSASAKVGPEQISLDDYDGLIALMLSVAGGIDSAESAMVDRLDARWEAKRSLVGR
jgi:endoglucanase